MSLVKDDARRAAPVRRPRASARPARDTRRASGPALATVVAAAVTVVVLVVTDAGPGTVLAAALTIAVLAAVTTRRAASNLFAGLGLLIVRPYEPGERIRLYVRERCTVVEAEIVRIGLIGTVLATDSGLLRVSNTRMLRAAPECAGR